MNFAILGSRGFPSSYGGYETLVRHLAPYMARSGHNVSVYCRGRENNQRSWVADGVRCIATAGKNTKCLSTPTFGATSTLDAVLRAYDAVLVLNIANGLWLPALRVTGTRFAVNTDGLEWERGKWNHLGRTVFRVGAWMTARLADEVICDSVAIGRIWEERFGRGSTFIPYGGTVVHDAGQDRLETAGGRPREPYLLVVARLIPENNVDLTLDALQYLGTAAPRAIIVGSATFGSPIEARLMALAKEGSLTWLGHIDDQRLLLQLWAHASVYVHGHSVGGTNPALLQALGAGSPTLALNTAFNAEVLPALEQLYDHDAKDLARKIAMTVASSDRQERFRARGRAIVGERYRWEDVCRRYTELLVRLGTTGTDPSRATTSLSRKAR